MKWGSFGFHCKLPAAQALTILKGYIVFQGFQNVCKQVSMKSPLKGNYFDQSNQRHVGEQPAEFWWSLACFGTPWFFLHYLYSIYNLFTALLRDQKLLPVQYFDFTEMVLFPLSDCFTLAYQLRHIFAMKSVVALHILGQHQYRYSSYCSPYFSFGTGQENLFDTQSFSW